MIEFIMSKFGILLFAFSVAGIMLLFVASVKDVFIADEGIQLSSVISKQLKEMSNSPSLCASTYVSLPRFIDVIGEGDSVTSTSLFYYLDINVVSSNVSGLGEDQKFIIFTLLDKRSSKILSVESFITTANVNLNNPDGDQSYIRVDPTGSNTLFLIKNTLASTGMPKVTSISFISCDYDTRRPIAFEDCYAKLIPLYQQGAYCVQTKDLSSIPNQRIIG